MNHALSPATLLSKSPQVGLENDKSHPLFSIGFRPFFFLATLTAVFWVPLWIYLLGGGDLQGHFSAFALHAHEMLFGFAGAVIAGFLLTAGSNWTGKRTATGAPLAGLCLLWAAARIAILVPSLPFWLVAAIDLSFFPALAIVLTVPVVASKNYRNLPFLIMLLLLFASNSLMYLEQASLMKGVLPVGQFGLGQTIALRTITLMMLVMGGRVIPMFTRNATRREHVVGDPVADRLALGLYLAVAILSTSYPNEGVVGALWVSCGAVHFYRMRTWGTRHASAPLLWILHFGYASIALSFVLEGFSLFGWVLPSVAVHALTVGGIGGLCLGMMTRVSLGHSGRLLVVPRSMKAAFLLLVLATTVRVLGPLWVPEALVTSYQLSGTLWTIAYGLLLLFGLPIWFFPRVDTEPRGVR